MKLISSYEQAKSKFGTTFQLLITLNINLDIQLASSNSNLIENIILTNNYLKGMKILLTVFFPNLSQYARFKGKCRKKKKEKEVSTLEYKRNLINTYLY